MSGEGGWGECFKRPLRFCESVPSPFCEGESQTHQCCHKRLYLLNKHAQAEAACSEPMAGLGSEQALAPNITPVCAANIHRQKNGGLERTYGRLGMLSLL